MTLADDVLELRLREHDPTRRLFAIHLRDSDLAIGALVLRLDRDDPRALSRFYRGLTDAPAFCVTLLV